MSKRKKRTYKTKNETQPFTIDERFKNDRAKQYRLLKRRIYLSRHYETYVNCIISRLKSDICHLSPYDEYCDFLEAIAAREELLLINTLLRLELL